MVNNLRVSSARLQRSLRATFLGLAANVSLTIAKFLAGIFGHSQALIADAVESLADIFSSIIVWRGLVVAETPPDDENEKVPIWNERQMAGQRADGSRTPGPSDEEIESSKGGLSGGGANPGGGERWAKRDVEPVED